MVHVVRFFDNGENIDGGLPGSANEDGDRFVEIWNLVFMEYDKKVEGLNKLKKKMCGYRYGA